MLGPIAFARAHFWAKIAEPARGRWGRGWSHQGRNVTPGHNLLAQNSNC
jgi:hypothetical protein